MARLFGTNGVRGVTNEDMNGQLALCLGLAIGTFFEGRIAVGTDTRTSNQMLKNAAVAGLLATGCPVVDAGVLPSPALQYYVKNHRCAAGVIVTASHNPPQFNGIKVVDGDGTELDPDREEEIESIYFSQTWKPASWDGVGQVTSASPIPDYIRGVVHQVDGEAIARRRYTVVADCGNGAGCLAYPQLLRRLGCRVITLNAQPDGTFPGRDAEPTPDNLELLLSTVGSCGADLGIAYDGDADRAIFVDERGRYVYGDKTLAMMAAHLVRREGGVVVTPVSTSSCVEEMVTEAGGRVAYTRVGSPIVARAMREMEATFGGEENGGLIFPRHQYCRDGGMASAALLELMAQREEPLSELVAEVPDYALVKSKVACSHQNKPAVMESFRQRAQNEGLETDTTDGVKIVAEEGWVLVRPSGTEPIIRIYAQSRQQRQAEQMASRYREWVEELVAEKG
ncbi:MAG: phosphoglucosamine mutase [Thermoplasmatota archaeon]